MSVFLSIVLFFIVLFILILAHEFGHFIVAKRSGIRVDEFGIGFPPKLFGIKKGETEYTFNLLPFGGFVKVFGEDPTEESLEGEDKERSFSNQPLHIQGAVIVAGVFFNLLLAWLLFSVGFMSGLPMSVGAAPAGAVVEDVRVIVTGVEPGSPAEEIELGLGDSIVSLSYKEESVDEVTILSLQSFIQAHDGDEVTLHIKRGEELIPTQIIPEQGIIPDGAAIGIAMETVGVVKLPVHRALWEGGKHTAFLTGAITVAIVNLIADAFTGSADLSGIAGPIGIVGLVGDAADFGFVYLLSFVAIISVNLAIINMIPFPGLDGGRFLFLLIEAVKGSPVSPAFANKAHMAGFLLLIGLLLLVSYNDLVRIFS